MTDRPASLACEGKKESPAWKERTEVAVDRVIKVYPVFAARKAHPEWLDSPDLK